MPQDWKQDFLDKWIVDKDVVLSKKKSDTVIILGSGPSINDIDINLWKFCNGNDTIAINWWIYHWFIPTFWYVEVGYDNPKTVDMWTRLMRKKCFLYKDVIWFHTIDSWLANVDEQEFKRFFPLGFHMYFYHRVLWNDWHKDIKKIFSDCKRQQSIDRFFSPSKTISSVLCAMFMAYVIGYKRIILAGIDLNVSTYYWTKIDIKAHCKTCYGDDISCKNEKHISEIGETSSNISTSTIIKTINEEIFKPEEIQLSVLSTKGALYPEIKLFKP